MPEERLKGTADKSVGGKSFGTGPGVFRARGDELVVFTAAGEFVFVYPTSDAADEAADRLQVALKGDSASATRLRTDHSWRHMMSFFGEHFPADIELVTWSAQCFGHKKRLANHRGKRRPFRAR